MRMNPLIVHVAAAALLASAIPVVTSMPARRRAPDPEDGNVGPKIDRSKRRIYSEPIGPEIPTRSKAARESATGRAATRRRRKMQEAADAGENG